MINAAMELGRTVGLDPVVGANNVALPIISGQYVRFANYQVTGDDGSHAGIYPAVTVAKGTDVIADCGDVIGIAADDTVYRGWNGRYDTIDGFYKYKKVSAYVLGGQFHIWNDGRGAVYADDVVGVKAGTPLYINADGVLDITAGGAGTIGENPVGIVLRAPIEADAIVGEEAIPADQAVATRGHEINFVAKNCRAHSVLFFKAVK